MEQALEGRVLGQKGGLTAVHILGELDVMCHEYTGMEEITFKTNLPAVTLWGSLLRSEHLDNCDTAEELMHFLGGQECQMDDTIKNMVSLFRDMQFRRFGVVGDDFTTLTCAPGIPIDDDRRPHFGILFWMYLQTIFGDWIGLKQYTWPSPPLINEDMIFEDLLSKDIGGFSVFSMQTIGWMDFVMAKATIKSKDSRAMAALVLETRKSQFRQYYDDAEVKEEFKAKLEDHSLRFALQDVEALRAQASG